MKHEPHPGPSLADDARHYRILRCATEAFLVHGFVGVSVENIAIDASVSKLTIYRFFGDKLGLATAVLHEFAESMENEMRMAIDMDASPEDCLLKVGLAHQRWMLRSFGSARHYFVMRLIIDLSTLHPPVVREWIDAWNRAMVYPLSEYMAKCLERGEMSGDDPFFIASQFSGFAYNPAMSLVSENSFNKDEAMMAKKVQLFLRGCGGKVD